MPKTVISRSSSGLEDSDRTYRSGHGNKKRIRFSELPDSVKNGVPDPVKNSVAYVEKMNKINEKFFQPYFDDPFNVDPNMIYNDLLEFFEREKKRFRAVNPDLIAQINFITNAMTLVRKDASQYFLLNLQNSAMVKQIESTIQGLIMNIYMLNTKISILTGYHGDDALSGSTKIRISGFKDPRYMMAQFQPDLSMLSFLYPNEPTAKYYTRLKRLLELSGLYESKQDITRDMIGFLDRFLVKHDLTLTLSQWLQIKENEKLLTTEELKEIEIGKEEIEIIKKREEYLDEWKKQHGDHSVLNGTFTMNVRKLDKILCRRYDQNKFRLDQQFKRFKGCKPARITGITPVPNFFERMMLIQGSMSVTTPDISFDLDTLENSNGSYAQDIIDRLSKLPSQNQFRSIKDKSCMDTCEPRKLCYTFPKCSITRKKCKTKNNKTRKNIRK